MENDEIQLIDFSKRVSSWKQKTKEKKTEKTEEIVKEEVVVKEVTQKYQYEQMLEKISCILMEKNSQQTQQKKIHLKPVELISISKSKYKWTNFNEFAEELKRKSDHLQCFVSAELGIETIINNDALRIDKKRLQ